MTTNTLPMLTAQSVRPFDAIIGFTGDYAFLSNFSSSPMMFGGLTCATAEHAFQMSKTSNFSAACRIATAGTPGRAKALGRRAELRPNWEQIKFEVMLDVLRVKFASHKDLANLLAATGGRWLEEANTWDDTTWGTVGGRGSNMLGLLLTRVRKERQPMELPCAEPRPSWVELFDAIQHEHLGGAS